MKKLTRSSVLRSDELLALLAECAYFITDCQDNGKNHKAVFLAANLYHALYYIDKDCIRCEVPLQNIRKKVVQEVIF